MFKDTKSLGNNKASAWESRGFVIKKEGMHFDTPSSHTVVFVSHSVKQRIPFNEGKYIQGEFYFI